MCFDEQRTDRSTPMAYLVSAVIVAVLLMQTLATFDIFPAILARPSSQFWPFTDYPMYRYARYEGATIEWYRVLATQADGHEIEVTPEDLGLNFRKFRDFVVTSVRINDLETVRRFAELYADRNGTRLDSIRLERSGVILERDGLYPAPLTHTPAIKLPSP